MDISELIPECTMEKFFFVEQSQKYDALKYLEDNKVCAIYRDDELWIAINRIDKSYKMAENRIKQIVTGII